jgi:hypothetical protein
MSGKDKSSKAASSKAATSTDGSPTRTSTRQKIPASPAGLTTKSLGEFQAKALSGGAAAAAAASSSKKKPAPKKKTTVVSLTMCNNC